MAEVFETINSRSSIRGYKDTPVETDKIMMIAEAGLKAPTAVNRREIHVTVASTKLPVMMDIQKEMSPDSQGNFFYNAPVFFALSGSNDYDSSNIDAGIAVENMALAAQALGLGNVIIGCIGETMKGPNKAVYNKALGIPEGYTFQIGLAVGYADVEKAQHEIDVEKDINVVGF